MALQLLGRARRPSSSDAFLSDRVLVLSPRPGCIVSIQEVPLPRPRTLRMMGSPEFAELTGVVRASLEQR